MRCRSRFILKRDSDIADGARNLGAQRAPDHRAHAADLLCARPADDLAVGSARSRTRPCRPLQVDHRATHAHGFAPADGNVTLDGSRRTTFSKWNGDAVERRIAIDEIDALRGDHDAAVRLHQPMSARAAENTLLFAPEFDHHELRAHRTRGAVDSPRASRWRRSGWCASAAPANRCAGWRAAAPAFRAGGGRHKSAKQSRAGSG